MCMEMVNSLAEGMEMKAANIMVFFENIIFESN